ncbi:MAG: dynein 14 kDa light chain, flagellar outer arm [Monoraphidium minutum]|nr:MAG: dynein 14 kDa light chain, flagellar outer arm [Monoraphidium minutum]
MLDPQGHGRWGAMAFQTDISTKEAWQAEVLGAAGALHVVELYADWAGPCKAVRELFKRMFFEAGDGVPLKFFTVNADKVAGLEQFRGRCEPQFTLYKDGKLLDKVEGVHGPKLAAMVAAHSKK